MLLLSGGGHSPHRATGAALLEKNGCEKTKMNKEKAGALREIDCSKACE